MAARALPAAAILALLVAAPLGAGYWTYAERVLNHLTTEHVTDAVEAVLNGGPQTIAGTTLDAVIPLERVFVHNAQGALAQLPPGYPAEMNIRLNDLGIAGPEPSTGIDPQGRIFFQAFISTLRSDDKGLTWTDITPFTASPVTFDPYLWVDPDTGRVINNQLIFGVGGVGCSWSVWTDHAGDLDPFGITWEGVNPRFCATVPEPLFVDHQKVHTGPIPSGHPLANLPVDPLVVYPKAVYFAWNTGFTAKIAMSLDGGLTFPLLEGTAEGTCQGGLHGRVRSLSDGTLLVPKRDCETPKVSVSHDWDLWSLRTVGNAFIGVSDHQKNPDIGVDTADNAYTVWAAADQKVWLSASTNRGDDWNAAVRLSPPHVGSTIMPSVVAGSPGRIAAVYYGTDDSGAAPDHVPTTARWHAYLTYSLNALDADPTFVTLQLTTEEDPIQIGCISARGDGHCGAANLLDFVDVVVSKEGWIAGAVADGCTTAENCANNPNATHNESDDNNGVAIVQLVGPDLIV